jgi:3-hydroxybutyryl-CoA dehydrogenase
VIEIIGVIGAGIMGGGIAQMFAEQDRKVLLWDADPDRLDAGLAKIRARLRSSVEKGKKPPEIMEQVLGRITPATGLADFSGSDLIVEAVTESMEVKLGVLSALSAVIRERAILATNTSSLSVTELAAAIGQPRRFLGTHFFNPPTKLELVELVPAPATAEEVIETTRGLLEACGKTPVVVKDTPGFIVNRLLQLMINEAARMLDEGVATAEDIDTAMRLGALHPIGPLGLADLIGLDTCQSILSILHEKLDSSSYAPARSLLQRVAVGNLGRKTGQGFFSADGGG